MRSDEYPGPLYFTHLLKILKEMKLIKGSEDIEQFGKFHHTEFNLAKVIDEINDINRQLENIRKDVYTLNKKKEKPEEHKLKDK